MALLSLVSMFTLSCEQPAGTEAAVSSDSSKSSSNEEKSTTNLTDMSKVSPATKGTADPIPLDLSGVSVDSLRPSNTKTEQPSDTPAVLAQVVTLTPESLDLGTFSTSEKGTGTVTLTNTGGKPVTLERAKASCGCTTSDFKNGTVLQPGESTDISVTMDGKGRARKLSKTVTFTIADHPSLRLPVSAETLSYVNVDKNPITMSEDNGIETITLTSIDGEPFTITSILPAIAVELPAEPSASQELKLDWQKFWDIVQTTKVTIRLDHPLCKEITTNVRLTADQRQRLNEIIKLRREGGDLPTKDPTRPLTGDQLARYIKSGRGAQVIKYINDGLGKYDAVDRGGVTLLSTAAEAGDVETVVALIDLGAEVERVDRVNRTPLMYAARSKDPGTVQVLLDEGADIQARDRLGNTPLSWAAGFGTADGVQILIDSGADANTVDTVLGYTPLIWAAGFGESAAISILIEAGADVSVNDIAEGRTPLMHAVRTGKVEGVKSLIDAGAKVNGIDNSKTTALHIGAESNNVGLDKIQLLVESGADVNAKNGGGETALDLAKFRTDPEGPAIVVFLESQTDLE